MERNGLRSRSFRHEDSNNRRVFLRSYPLQWREEEKRTDEEEKRTNEEDNVTDEETAKVNKKKTKKPIKQIILSVFNWGEGKVLVLRRFKHKLAVYVIACIRISFKHPKALISA